MSATYTQMQTRVSRRVIDLPSAVLAEVPKLVNVALTMLQEKHNFKVMETELSAYTLVNSHSLYATIGGTALNVPTNFKEWRGEPWYLRYQDGSPYPMTMAPSQESIWGAFNNGGAINSDIGFPQAVLEGVSTDYNVRALLVYPLPDGASDYSDGEYRITLPYYRYLPELSADGDHNWLTDQASGEEFIVHWAAGEAHALNWDFQKYAILTKTADMHMRNLVKADKQYRLSAVREWVPHWRGVHTTKTRL